MSKNRNSNGLFITLEGVEGVGKTTNLQFIEQWLSSRQIPVLVTREPGGTEIGERVRTLLLDNTLSAMHPVTELMLISAARAQHINEVIRPALEAGTWVLCDRFTDATYAYQGGGRQLPLTLIAQLEQLVQEGFQPDRTFFLDLDVAAGLRRAASRGAADRFEQENKVFFENVRTAYWQRIRKNPERFDVIDAGPPLHEVQTQIAARLQHLVTNRNA